MATIKGVKALAGKIERIIESFDDIRDQISEKENWMQEQPDKWQDSAAADKWNEAIAEAEALMDEIEGISLPDFE